MSNAVAARQYIERGIADFHRNQFAHAVAAFEIALQLNPEDAYARYNRATALLSLGDYARGFPEHEVAWRLFHWRGFGPVREDIDRLTAELPLWRGEDDVELLVYHELGFGDAIMAMRYLPELKRRARSLMLVIDPALARLTTRHFDIAVTDCVPDDLTVFDCRLPLFSVMASLSETGATIPATPYIKAHWKFTGWRRTGTRVGIAWSGRTQTGFTLDRFLELLDHHGFSLHALQPGPTDDRVEPLPEGNTDFADVAERIAGMRHIISVDTAAIHLAGAMGHPSAHLLLPYLSDWRWHRTELWYPTLQTYRQHDASDWSAPFAKLNETLYGQH